jgi:CheY-like chemotaxis protein
MRILVVDDQPDTLVCVTDVLAMRGHEVRCELDGPAGLRAVAELEPDIVLIDIAMPGMTGWEVARRIRSLELPQQPRLIALTGFTDHAHREYSLSIGFEAHVTKPFGLADLDRALGEHRT